MSRATCCGVQAQEVAAPRADERRQGAASSGEALDRGLISWTPTMAIARIGVLWRGYLGAETLTRFTVPLLLATHDCQCASKEDRAYQVEQAGEGLIQRRHGYKESYGALGEDEEHP